MNDSWGAPFPISLSQQNIWRLEQSFPGTAINNICNTIRIKGRFDAPLIQKSLNLLIEADEALRTRILLREDAPCQYRAAFSQTQFPFYDFTLTSRQGFFSWEEAFARTVMPLIDCPLYQIAVFRLSENEGGVIIKTHHLISDGWTQTLLGNRLADLYLELVSTGEATLEVSTAPPGESHYPESKAYVRDRAFWEEKLRAPLYPAALKQAPGAEVSLVGRRKSFAFSELPGRQIYAFCQAHRVSPFSVVYMALATYLSRILGSNSLCIGVPVAGRTDYALKQATGMYVSTLPFTCEIDQSWSFLDFTKTLTGEWFDLLKHQRFPFTEIMELSKKYHPGLDRLFHIVLSYQNGRNHANRDASVHFSGRWHYSGCQHEQLCIHLSNMEDEKEFVISYDYLTQLFSEADIDRLHGHLLCLLTDGLAHPDKPIGQLSMLDEEEKERVLFRFNNTQRRGPAPDLLDRLAGTLRGSKRTALIQGGRRMPYAELGSLANAFSRLLLEWYPEERVTVALLLPKGFALVAGMLGALQSGNTWVILPPDLPRERLAHMLEGSGAAVLAGDAASLGGGLHCAHTINMDELNPSAQHTWREADPDGIAYLAYTSGSTGRPKGVEITRRSLLNFAAGMREYFGHGAVLSTASIGFDVFLLESVVSLLCGRTVILPDEAQGESPALLAQLIKSYGVGFFAMTPSRLAAYLGVEEFAQSLSGVERIVCGGEAFPGELVQALAPYTKARVYNQYGPAETTIGASIGRMDGSPAITAGRPMPGCRVYVLDKNRMPLPVNAEGELYIGGVCVGRGYRGESVLTETAFVENPFEYGERMYRTGDMGWFTPEGELVVTGRRDSQVKLRGQRIEPQEVSARLMAHPEITGAAVKVFYRNESAALAAYYTAGRELPQGELLSFMAAYLPAYMVPAHLLYVQSIPLTANGKVDFSLLPEPEERANGAAPQTAMQEKILALFRRVLKRDGLGIGSDFFLCGGDSLSAIALLADLEHEFGVKLRVSDLYLCRDAVRLEQLICPQAKAAQPQLLKAPPDRDRFPLTPIQQSIYVQAKLDATSLAYNMPGAFRLPSNVDLARLRNAFAALPGAEPMLRVCFMLDGAQAVQRVTQAAQLSLDDISAPDFAAARDAFVRAFDLSTAPLMRAGLWEDIDGSHVLFIDMHHIISDGLSAPLLMQRLDALYNGQAAESSLYNYLDYTLWPGDTNAATTDYWKKALDGAGQLDLPTDFKRQQVFDYVGGKHAFSLDAALSARCDAYCRERGVSAYTLFAGIFGILLQKGSGCADFLVGTPVSGRRTRELEAVFGPLLATLPLRLSPGQEQTARDYMEVTGQRVVGLLDHQDIGMEELLSLSGAKRRLSEGLYHVMFSMRPVDPGSFALGGQALEYIPLDAGTAKFDLNLEAGKQGDCYTFLLEYAASLFERATIEYYGRCFATLVESVLADDAARICDLPALCAQDRRSLIDIPNRTFTPYLNMPLDMQIDEISAQRPNQAAIIFHGEPTTYGEILRRADALAGFLQAQGVRHGDNVAFCLKRGPDNLTAMLGILKAGAAYVPMIASLPGERIRYMLENSGAKLLLCDDATRDSLPADVCPVLDLVTDHTPYAPVPGRSGEDIMQVLYTSGTTGRPKGVMLKMKSLCNLLPVMAGLLNDIHGNFLCITNAIFDTFITETLYQMALGRTIVMADEEEMMLPWKIAGLIEAHDGGMIQFTPSRLQLCLANEAFTRAMERIGFTLVCGEVFPMPLLDKLRATGGTRIVTMYGPTEVTVYMTYEDVTDADRMVVGHTMQNCRVYALDGDMRPVMPTARGELYIAGECLSAGYINRPDLTEASFLPDPFYGGLMYKTGDIARMRLDGNYEFWGRKDAQVKLNGQRIELGEVTGQMLLADAVSEAAVVAAKREDGSAYLHGYVVFKEGHAKDTDALKRRLKKDLPTFMVPSILTVLDEMPRTASGKTDVLLLSGGAAFCGEAVEAEKPSADDSGVSSAGYTAVPASVAKPAREASSGKQQEETQATLPPEGDMLVRIMPMWREVLETDAIDPAVSFFDQGGTSLGAVTLVGMYFEAGWEITLEQFYNTPTPAGQAALLTGRDVECEPVEASTLPVAAESTPQQCETVVSPSAASTVLLTGATGFLGAHLIPALLDTGIERVICVVRGGQARLVKTLEYYFGQPLAQQYAAKTEAVEGDISQPGFGIAQPLLQDVAARTHYVLHAAADTRHYASDENAVKANCGGTAHAIEIAQQAGARLLHISTISVCGEYLRSNPQRNTVFTEADYDIGQNWQDNVYVKSKFMAEQLVRDAIAGGLDAKLFRMGRLVGRRSDGKFQKNKTHNTFYAVVQGAKLLDCYPRSMAPMPIELSAVDDCARAVALLRDGQDAVYHVFNPHTLPLKGFLGIVRPGILPASDTAFDEHVRERIRAGHLTQLAILLETRTRLKQRPVRIEPNAERTVGELLARSFLWEEPDISMLLREFTE